MRTWIRRRLGLRRVIIVERGTQLMLVLRVVLYLVVMTVIALGIMLYPSASRLTVGAGSLEDLSAASREFLFLDLKVVPVFLAVMVAVAVHFLFVTNRIFGPLWRLTREMRRWREERVWPPAMRLRRRDFHGGLFAEFNGATEVLGQDLAAVREQLRGITAEARSLARQVDAGPTAEGLKLIDEQCRSALERVERWQL